jgi:formate dehydrogenase iron-sulfur subunit
MCSTKALLAGDADVISDVYRNRIVNRSASVMARGVSYGESSFRAPKNMSGKSSSKE